MCVQCSQRKIERSVNLDQKLSLARRLRSKMALEYLKCVKVFEIVFKIITVFYLLPIDWLNLQIVLT